MPQPRKYANEAERKRAYRARKKALEEAAVLQAADDLRAELAVRASQLYSTPGVQTADLDGVQTEEDLELARAFTAGGGQHYTPARRGSLISLEEYTARIGSGEHVISLRD